MDLEAQIETLKDNATIWWSVGDDEDQYVCDAIELKAYVEKSKRMREALETASELLSLAKIIPVHSQQYTKMAEAHVVMMQSVKDIAQEALGDIEGA